MFVGVRSGNRVVHTMVNATIRFTCASVGFDRLGRGGMSEEERVVYTFALFYHVSVYADDPLKRGQQGALACLDDLLRHR